MAMDFSDILIWFNSNQSVDRYAGIVLYDYDVLVWVNITNLISCFKNKNWSWIVQTI